MRNASACSDGARAERLRLDTLREYRIMDTPPEAAFDRVTKMVADLYGVPIALVSLVDDCRQWFKSAYGLDATETPREMAMLITQDVDTEASG